MNYLKKHVCLHVDDLARALGLEGEVRSVWVEPGTDYVHVQLEWQSQRPAPDGFLFVAHGGYTPIDGSFSESVAHRGG